MSEPVGRILITGATGFIGSGLAACARSQGWCVTAVGLVRNELEAERRRELAELDIQVIEAGLDDEDALRSCVRSQDVVMHLGAAQHEAHMPEAHFQAINVEGTGRLLKLAQESGVRRFVYGSSIGVYGESADGELRETDPVSPANAYTRSKAAAEVLVRGANGLEAVIARISEAYGPGDRRLLKLFRAVEQGTYRTIGEGCNERQPIFIDDLCRALMALATAPGAAGETVILAGEECLSTDQMVEAIGVATGRPVSTLHLPAWPFKAAAVVSEKVFRPLGIEPPLTSRRLDFFLRNFRLSTAKARRILGFASVTTFAEGARRTADWYRARGLLGGRAGEPNWLAVLFAASLAGLATISLWRFQHRLGPSFVALFAKEGVLEDVTFVLELLAAALCGVAVWRFSKNGFPAPPVKLARWMFAALALGLFAVGMEEINWGQTLLGFNTPEAWKEINYQQETSLHNLADKTALTESARVIAVLLALGAIALMAIRTRIPKSILGQIAPHPALLPLSLCIAYAGLKQHPEVIELLISIFFAFYTYRLWSISRAGMRKALNARSPEEEASGSAARWFRIAIAVGLTTVLVGRFDWTQARDVAAGISWPLLFGAAVAMALTLVISAWKWNWALQMHELHHRFPFVLKTLSIGFFFNHFLPTAVGGDAYRVLRTFPRDGFRSRALSAVIVERVVGLFALLSLGAVGALRLVETRGVMHEFLYALIIAAGVGTVAALAAQSSWLKRAVGRWRSVPAVKSILHNGRLLRTHPNAWAGLILGSFAFQLVSVGIIFVLFASLSVTATPAQCAMIAAMVGLSAMLPLSINGIGVTEGAFVATAVGLGIDYEAAFAVALLRRGLAMLLAVPCGGLWLADAHRMNRTSTVRELARYFAAWKRDGMRGLLDELQPVAPAGSQTARLDDAIPDVPLSLAAPPEELSHAALLEYTNDAIIIWEMGGRGVLYWNQAAERLYGYSRQEAFGKVTHTLLETHVTGGVEVLESTLARYGVWVGELRHRTYDGRKVSVEGRLSLLSQQNGRWLVLEVNRDITDRKAAEAARQSIEAQLAELRATIETRRSEP